MSLLLLFNQNVPQAEELTTAIEGADWTAIGLRLASDPQAVASITGEIGKLEELLAQANLTNAERVQAGASINALKSLIFTPTPEWRAITVILSGSAITALCNLKEIAEIVGLIIRLVLG